MSPHYFPISQAQYDLQQWIAATYTLGPICCSRNAAFPWANQGRSRTDEKIRWKCPSYKKSIQFFSQQGVKNPDTMANLTWANTYISGIVMREAWDCNSGGIVIRSTLALHTGLCVFDP